MLAMGAFEWFTVSVSATTLMPVVHSLFSFESQQVSDVANRGPALAAPLDLKEGGLFLSS
jgi:hypothetical protein